MKILIRLPNWLGDVVMSTAFVAAVRQLYPLAAVDIIIKREMQDLATLIPGVNRVHLLTKQEHTGLRGVFHFGKALRKYHYDIFFNLPHSLSSALLAWMSFSKKRVGFDKEGAFFLMTDTYKKPLNLHRVDEYLCLLRNFTGKAIPDKQVKLSNGKAVIFQNQSLIVNFNSEAESRRMPLDKGRRIINSLLTAFTEVKFILIGAPKDTAFIDNLMLGLHDTSRISNYAGKTNLLSLTQLMAGSKAVLSTDSGPAHLANALGMPTVVLFGAGNEHNTAPYNKKDLTVIRYGELVCEPCVRNTCQLYGIPKCMQLLDELKIINALSLYLNHA